MGRKRKRKRQVTPSCSRAWELTSHWGRLEPEVGTSRGACGAMDLPCALGLGTLLALPGVLGSGGSAKDTAGSSSVTVVLLLLLLLLLVAGLALAWRRLSRDSGGYYHPARLGAALWGRARRLLRASPPGRWLRARAELQAPDEDPEQQDDEQDEEDYSLGGSSGEAQPREEQRRGEERGPQPAGPAQEARGGDPDGGLGLGPQELRGSGGSAEALLSDLHAFAGSAAWDDSAGAAGGKGLHVTAL